MAANDYRRSSKKRLLRKRAVYWIEKYSEGHGKFDAFIPYLAVHYFDRFISRNLLPAMDGWEKDLKLLTICCLALAWKMRSRNFIYVEFLQANRSQFLVINVKNIMNMELKILEALNWHMRAVTAFCFVQYFFSKVPRCSLNRRTINEIIIQAQGDMKYTRFKPSTIAAGAFLAAALTSRREEEYATLVENIGEDWKLNHADIHACKMEMGLMCYTGKFPVETAEGEVMDGQERSRVQTGDAGSAGLSSSVRIPRPGKTPHISELPAIQEVEESEEEIPRRRPGKEREQSRGELLRLRPGLTRMLEIQESQEEENGPEMSIPLKWTAHGTQDSTADPSWFATGNYPTEGAVAETVGKTCYML